MFKPFFSNPFKALSTRDGVAIGEGSERTMLDAVGDRNGFLKRFLTNSDGSTTMLQTRGGMPHFSNTGGGVNRSVKSVSDGVEGDGQTLHTVDMFRSGSKPITIPFQIQNTGAGGVFWYELSNSSFSDGVTISLTGVSKGFITIPAGVMSFTVTIVNSNYISGFTYQLTVGNRSGFYTIP